MAVGGWEKLVKGVIRHGQPNFYHSSSQQRDCKQIVEMYGRPINYKIYMLRIDIYCVHAVSLQVQLIISPKQSYNFNQANFFHSRTNAYKHQCKLLNCIRLCWTPVHKVVMNGQTKFTTISLHVFIDSVVILSIYTSKACQAATEFQICTVILIVFNYYESRLQLIMINPLSSDYQVSAWICALH